MSIVFLHLINATLSNQIYHLRIGIESFVYRAVYHHNGTLLDVALKKRIRRRYNANDVYREIELLIICAQLDRSKNDQSLAVGGERGHPNIVGFIGFYINKNDEICLLLEFLRGKTLERFLHPGSNRNVYSRLQHGCCYMNKRYMALPNQYSTQQLDSLDKILSIIVQLCEGMQFLAELKIIHRDLAARNCV